MLQLVIRILSTPTHAYRLVILMILRNMNYIVKTRLIVLYRCITRHIYSVTSTDSCMTPHSLLQICLRKNICLMKKYLQIEIVQNHIHSPLTVSRKRAFANVKMLGNKSIRHGNRKVHAGLILFLFT